MKAVSRAIVVLALCCAPQMAFGQGVLLRLSPVSGLVSQYHTATRVWVASAVMPQADPDRPLVSQQGYLTQTVTGVSGGVARIATVVDSAQLQLPPGFQGPPPDMTGMRFSLTMDSRGRVVSSGVDQSSVPAGLRGFESQFQQIFAAISFEFPEAAVAPGASWTSAIDETIAGPVGPMVTSNEARYTLERIDVQRGKRHAVIRLDGTVSQRSAVDPERPAMMSVDVAGDVRGRFIVDIDTGRLVSLENTTTLEGEVRIGNSTEGIPIRITSETGLDLLPR